MTVAWGLGLAVRMHLPFSRVHAVSGRSVAQTRRPRSTTHPVRCHSWDAVEKRAALETWAKDLSRIRTGSW